MDFLKWESGVIHEMEDNPIHGNAFHRTMYGFAFFTGNRTDCFCDANREFLLQKYEEKRELGLLVGPILSKTYYFAQLNQMKEVRKSFSAEVQNSAKEYVDLVKKIKSLPGVIEINKFYSDGDEEPLPEGTVMIPLKEKVFSYHILLVNPSIIKQPYYSHMQNYIIRHFKYCQLEN